MVQKSRYQYDTSSFHHENLAGDRLKVSFLLLAILYIVSIFCLKGANVERW